MILREQQGKPDMAANDRETQTNGREFRALPSRLLESFLPSGRSSGIGSPMSPKHRLDSGKIVETATNLAHDITARLPGSTLAALADELKAIAITANERNRQARQPILIIRALSATAIAAILVALWYLARHIHAKWEFGTITEVFDGLHTGFELAVIFAGTLWFCVTLEARLKRRKALAFIEDLREFIHVIDVTQLYYTPDLYHSRTGESPTKLALDEHYLLYCTQMLAIISNLAPLAARGAPGDSVLRAASDVEMLANAVSLKHMSKAEFVRTLE